MRPGAGISYCINNSRPYRQMLDVSVRSLERVHRGVNREISQLHAGGDWLDSIRWHCGSTLEHWVRKLTVGDDYAKKARHKAMAEKIRLFSNPPFEHTLFIDCDTIVLRPLTAVFDALAAGADVVVQAWKPEDYYGTCPPFTTEPFRRYNSGVVGFSQAFAKDYAAIVQSCTLDIAGLHDQDQYVFSQLLHQIDKSRVVELPHLQIANDADACRELGAVSIADAARIACTGDIPYSVFHYIMKKKQSLGIVRRYV
jgi:hypothetical protein